ncbi:hypothetical protein A9798_15445 [Edwardsiella hoshinae]|uniref:DUF2913 family protein n=1 Tax=Edwardsiella hoshinae TaxID=93378 RepID=A0ABN4T1W6_9GAMM|nr:DUF2913 family protein [Edwardsiella hoshinae]AOV98207.1 hypothetical protein A9798_15445 [Edwardsiella hoshinae]
MKKPTRLSTPEHGVADLAHFAWCAQVALALAKQDGKALSPLTEHTFLVNWLVAAHKQRRFPRSIAADIDNLLQLGRRKGLAAGLAHRLACLWQDAIAPAQRRSALQRLTEAIRFLNAQGWLNAVIDDAQWHPASLQAEYADTSALLVSKSDLRRQFSPVGTLLGEITFLVIGDHQVVVEAVKQHELHGRLADAPEQGCAVILVSEPPDASSQP